jgi:hypothetical protein
MRADKSLKCEFTCTSIWIFLLQFVIAICYSHFHFLYFHSTTVVQVFEMDPPAYLIILSSHFSSNLSTAVNV